MAGTVFFLTQNDAVRLKERLQRDVTGDRYPDAPTWWENRQRCRATSATPQTFGGINYYPGAAWHWNHDTLAWVSLGTCWMRMVNGGVPDTTQYLSGFQTGFTTISADFRPAFDVDDGLPGTVTTSITFSGAINYTETTAAFTANTNNYAATATANYIYLTGANAIDFTGIVAPSPETSRVIVFRNDKADNITLKYDSSSSTAGNRFYTYSGEDHIVAPGEQVKLQYDTVNNRWLVMPEGDSLYENKKQVTFNTGTTQNTALLLDKDAPGSNGQRDSDIIHWRGTSYDGSAHIIDWRAFIDVTSNAGESKLVIQRQIDGGGYTNYLSLSDAGNLTVNLLTVSEQATPSTPASGFGVFYFKSDGKPYAIGDGGVEYNLSGGPAWTSVSKSFSDFSDTDTANDIEVYSLAAGEVIHMAIARLTTQFTGGALVSYHLSAFGFTGSLSAYWAGPSWDMKNEAVDTFRELQLTMPDIRNFSAATSIRASVASTGANLNAATAGAVTFYLLTSTP